MSARPSRRPRFSTRSVASLLVIRLLLIANSVTLLTIGALYLGYGSKPGGYVVGGVLIAVAALLLCCIPVTDPYRSRRR
jgi:hypothetical protein